MERILITGANRGIGLEFTRSFLADGWTVHATCRDPQEAGELRALIERAGGESSLHELDVSDGAAVAGLAEALAGKPLDILLNNAGIYGPRLPFGETDYEAWARVLAVNTMAPLRLTEAFAPAVASSRRKLIVNISSKVGSIAENSGGGSYIYRSSKTALNMVVKSLSIDLAAQGITVVVLHPGWVKTDMGGPNALIGVEESVSGMRRVIDSLGPAQSGTFYQYDGTPIPW